MSRNKPWKDEVGVFHRKKYCCALKYHLLFRFRVLSPSSSQLEPTFPISLVAPVLKFVVPWALVPPSVFQLTLSRCRGSACTCSKRTRSLATTFLQLLSDEGLCNPLFRSRTRFHAPTFFLAYFPSTQRQLARNCRTSRRIKFSHIRMNAPSTSSTQLCFRTYRS